MAEVTLSGSPAAPIAGVKEKEVPKPDTEQVPETLVASKDPLFDQMAKLEKQRRMQAKQYQAEKAAWESEKAQLLQKAQPDTSWKDRAKTDLMGLMAEAGLSYEEVLNTYVNHTPMDQNMRILQAKLQGMEENQNKLINQFTETQKQNYNQAVKQITTEVKQLVKLAPDDYEIINSQGEMAEKYIVKLIEETFQDEGYLMDVEDAAKEVENHLLEQSLGLAKLKKIQAKLSPTQTLAQGEVAAPKVSIEPKGATTLSHNMTAGSKPISNRERRERAILAFQGKLST